MLTVSLISPPTNIGIKIYYFIAILQVIFEIQFKIYRDYVHITRKFESAKTRFRIPVENIVYFSGDD